MKGSFVIDRIKGKRTRTTIASVSHSGQDILRGFLQNISDTGLNARGLRETIDLTDLYVDSHVSSTTGRGVRLVWGADFLHGIGEAKGAAFDYHVPLSGATATALTPPSALNLGSDDRRDFAGAYGS